MECAKALEVNAGTEPGADIGPVISKQVQYDLSYSLSFSFDLLYVEPFLLMLCNNNCLFKVPYGIVKWLNSTLYQLKLLDKMEI